MMHTPGPWKIVVEDDDQLQITCDARKSQVEIATIAIGFDEPFESEQEANARLIASAPELLATVNRLRGALERIYKINQGDNDNVPRLIAEEAAKALGGAPMAKETCGYCGTELNLDGCMRCGAPVCCPKCCAHDWEELCAKDPN